MNELINIVVTGPESTGKSTLTEQLAQHFNTVFVPEYAREYVSNLHRPYTFSDVEHIAKKQVEQKQQLAANANKLLFLDTYLIVTKIWFLEVYKQYPVWLDGAIRNSNIKLFLLCDTDLPWVPDGVRENGGERRKYLFEQYKNQLEHYGFTYRIINGLGQSRLNNAIGAITEVIGKVPSD